MTSIGLGHNILKTAGDVLLFSTELPDSTVVCCGGAVRTVILVTAWLLVIMYTTPLVSFHHSLKCHLNVDTLVMEVYLLGLR